MVKSPKHAYEFGPFRLDTIERLLRRDEEIVPLTPKAFETLLLLVRNSGHVVSKDELMRTLWPDTAVDENNLTQNISALRKALGEGAHKHYIETISKLGYRFIGPVRVLQGLRSIAVLPFQSLQADNIDEYLGLGLADALITRLGNIRQFVVRPTSAVRKYTDPAQDPTAVGQALGVEAVLQGSLRRLGDRMRVTVQLVSVADGSPLWADKFDEKVTDLFALEDAISERVAGSLMLRLTGEEKRQLAKRHTENTEAYQLYLKGRFHWNKRTGEGLLKGLEHFQQAIEKDTGYALAYTGLADCYNLLSLYGVLPPREAMPKAKRAAARALELDNSLAEAHTSLAYTKLYYDWDWPGSESEFQRALALNPNYATAHHWYHEYLTAMGRFDEDLAEILRAQELDPLSLIINTDIAWGRYFARQYDRAIEQLQKTLELDPNFAMARFVLGLSYAQKGRFAESITEIQKAIDLSGDSPLTLAIGVLGHAYAVSGHAAEARKVLKQLQDLSKRQYVPAYSRAIVYMGLGEMGPTFQWLEKAYEERYDRLIYLNVDPMWDNLRSDPRFADLLSRVVR